MGTGVIVSAAVRSWDALGFRAGSSSVREVPGRSKVLSGGDSGICISFEDSDRLKDANGLRFFSAFLSKLPEAEPTTLFRRLMTVPRRRRPPSGVCRGCGSGASRAKTMSEPIQEVVTQFPIKLTWGCSNCAGPLRPLRPLTGCIILNARRGCKRRSSSSRR